MRAFFTTRKMPVRIMMFLPMLFSTVVSGGKLQSTIDSAISRHHHVRSGVGIVFRDVDTDSILVAVNAETMYNPASVSKLVTAAAALELLGTSFTFPTRIYVADGFPKKPGSLNGSIYIRGGGDPGFTAERIWLFVQHLRHSGLRQIEGNLVIDDYLYDSITIGPGFDEDSTSRAYQPLISALSANFNTIAIHHRSGDFIGAPVQVELFPRISGVKILSTAKTVSAGSSSTLDISTSINDNKTCINVKGAKPIDEKSAYTYRKVWNTWETFGGAVEALFQENGIKFNGTIMHGPTPDSLLDKPFYEFPSEPLSVFVNHMFKYSSNFASEMIFKSLPLYAGSSMSGKQGSWSGATALIAKWWAECKLPGQPVIRNGSGMGNVNRISAVQICALLDHVWDTKKYLPEYLNALSVSGVDGTIKSRFKNSRLKGIIRGKTGTLNSYGVSTLSGYLLLARRTVAFAIICNKTGQGQFENWTFQEDVIEKVVAGLGN